MPASPVHLCACVTTTWTPRRGSVRSWHKLLSSWTSQHGWQWRLCCRYEIASITLAALFIATLMQQHVPGSFSM